jgi:PadR family transcriptional regulator PadR
VSKDALQITQGSLYPALHRLEQQGWLKAQAGVTRTGRDAKFYALTAAGRKQLARELESWERLSNAIGLVLREVE